MDSFILKSDPIIFLMFDQSGESYIYVYKVSFTDFQWNDCLQLEIRRLSFTKFIDFNDRIELLVKNSTENVET